MALTPYEVSAVTRGIQGWLAQAPPGTSAAYAAQWAQNHYDYFRGVGYNTYLQIAEKVVRAESAAFDLLARPDNAGLIKDLPVVPGYGESGQRFNYRVLVTITNTTTGVVKSTLIDVDSDVQLSAIDIEANAERVARRLANSGGTTNLTRRDFQGSPELAFQILTASRAY